MVAEDAPAGGRSGGDGSPADTSSLTSTNSSSGGDASAPTLSLAEFGGTRGAPAVDIFDGPRVVRCLSWQVPGGEAVVLGGRARSFPRSRPNTHAPCTRYIQGHSTRCSESHVQTPRILLQQQSGSSPNRCTNAHLARASLLSANSTGHSPAPALVLCVHSRSASRALRLAACGHRLGEHGRIRDRFVAIEFGRMLRHDHRTHDGRREVVEEPRGTCAHHLDAVAAWTAAA
jgi:hypothetical protein